MIMVTAIMGTMGIVIIVATTATEIEVTEIITATMATATMATGTTTAGKALPSHAEAANAVDHLVVAENRLPPLGAGVASVAGAARVIDLCAGLGLGGTDADI
jgi:hypothetical protein